MEENSETERSYGYQKEWSEGFREDADMDIVVQGKVLPIHIGIMCQSDVMRTSIKETTNKGRIQIGSPFAGYSIDTVDFLLQQIYCTRGTFNASDMLCEKRDPLKAMELAIRLGFEPVVEKILKGLDKNILRGVLMRWGRQEEKMVQWLSLIDCVDIPELTRMTTTFYADNFGYLFSNGYDRFNLAVHIPREMLVEMLAILWERVPHEVRTKNSSPLPR